MLVYPRWSEFQGERCRALQWAPHERFAPYIAQPLMPLYSPPDLQVEDSSSSGGSSPERGAAGAGAAGAGAGAGCAWRGCGATFASVARLSAHVARAHAHPHADGLFYCHWSGCLRPQRGFNARYKMLVHVRTHTNERPHVCGQCSKSFSRAENLKIHLRSHSGEKPYVCPYEGCGKAYSNSSDRFKHTRTHTVDKPYSCKVPGCSKRYTDPSSLRKHVKTYKHFGARDKDSSDEASQSPLRETEAPYSRTSPYTVPVSRFAGADVTYMPREVYRVPSSEMSHTEYTQMYDRAYSSYYSMDYPVFRPVYEKSYSYEDSMGDNMGDIGDMGDKTEDVDVETLAEEPLNLKCHRQPHSIEELIRRTDLPLDLSTKS